jgi:hypothetical protein
MLVILLAMCTLSANRLWVDEIYFCQSSEWISELPLVRLVLPDRRLGSSHEKDVVGFAAAPGVEVATATGLVGESAIVWFWLPRSRSRIWSRSRPWPSKALLP